jgi:transcription-repair coupling factor (superfamily II helicase)
VGFELYCQLLKQEITLLKHGKVRQYLPDVDVNIEFIRYGCRGTDAVLAAGIPPEYIDSEKHRLNIFRNLAHLCSESDVADYRMELIDRFGKLPPETENLLTLCIIKILAAQAGFTSITVQENRVLLRRGTLATYRSTDGRMPRLNGNSSAAERLTELLRAVRLAALEIGSSN